MLSSRDTQSLRVGESAIINNDEESSGWSAFAALVLDCILRKRPKYCHPFSATDAGNRASKNVTARGETHATCEMGLSRRRLVGHHVCSVWTRESTRRFALAVAQEGAD